ncbi:uncharacterized protein LOC128984243 [Macrosteles quadrilineatus]|uniref:uncharacterized protein LOC128984243 n=1 Tax=Macrosteles quadrilineatus TaxID=74068 RepID=UPI0023E33C4C|nr:uncharacterized protein LOC128984243 [Macrosteles quadrilineatus]
MLLCLGTLDGLNSRVFGRWLLTDGDQSVIASQAITNLETHNVAMTPGATLNSHNISHIRDAALSRYSGWAQLSCVWQMAVDRRRPECYSLTGHHQPRTHNVAMTPGATLNSHNISHIRDAALSRWLLTDGDQSVIASQAITNLETHNVAMTPGATLTYVMLLCLGTLDGLNSRVFGRWLLTDGDQSVIASQAITNLETHNVAMTPGATLNSHNISHLLTDAVLLSENTTFDKVVFGGPVSTLEVQIGGRMSHLQVPADIVMTDSAADQLITGHKTVHGSVSLAGDLLTIGLVSDVNVTAFCLALHSNQSKLVISGNGKFNREPEVLTSVDGFDWHDIMDNVWFKDDNVTDLHEVSMDEVEIRNLTVVDINNNNVEEQLSRLVSLSADQVINGTFYFPSVRAEKGLKAEKATVGGNIEGIQLPLFIENVLLNGIDQKICGYLDFNKLVIKHNLNNSMFVNGLNMTSDLMLANVESNTMSAELTLDQLITRQLRLPAGAPLAGVDVLSWSRSAVTKSGIKHVISGNITVTGQLDSGHGIRVKGLVNGLPFDEKNLMTLNGAQETKGKKRFSSETRLTIHNLTVEGSFNDLNFTAFCDEQVTARGDVENVRSQAVYSSCGVTEGGSTSDIPRSQSYLARIPTICSTPMVLLPTPA